jgi:glycosyltransferase involved in cell wall biosynthesis
MKSVLVAHPHPDLYGADRVLLEAIDALTTEGVAVRVVVPEAGPLLELFDERSISYDIVPFPVIRKALLKPASIGRLGATLPRDVRRLRRLIDEMRPDLVYVNTLTLPHWLLASRLAGVASLCHVHESDERYSMAVRRVLCAPLVLADKVVAVSGATAEFLTKSVGRLARTTAVVHNGIRFDRPATSLPPFGGQLRMVVVGRLSENKGQDLAIDALAGLVERGCDATLELVGGVFPGYEWFESQLRDQAQRRGVAQRVQFSGFQADPLVAVSRAHLVLAPSRTDSSPLVPLEAMGIGRPIVAARVGGLPEIVDDGRTGILVEAGDPEPLTTAVARLVNDQALCRAMGATAAVVARRRYSVERFRHEIVAVARTTSEDRAVRGVPSRVRALAEGLQ